MLDASVLLIILAVAIFAAVETAKARDAISVDPRRFPDE